MIDKTPARARSLDQILETYERLDKHASPADQSLRERTAKDPFGFEEDRPEPDPFKAAKTVVEKFANFFLTASASAEGGALSVEEMVFAAELAFLNILNAADLPFTAAKAEEIRALAMAFYAEHYAASEPVDAAEPTEAPLTDPAKHTARRMVQYFMLACEEYQLTAREMLFTAELAACNILDPVRIPLNELAVSMARDAAYAYYVQSLPLAASAGQP
jgi:hypothetical protein